uniref:CASPASE_P20 domain-containing protein n=1 Tax=Macrostomum lignano TaxID=282301 RepID=A0A1I8GNI1_9PLAT
ANELKVLLAASAAAKESAAKCSTVLLLLLLLLSRHRSACLNERGHRREKNYTLKTVKLALFFDAGSESVTDEYADFLKECSFNVKRSLEQQYESKLGSCLSDFVNNSEVQQLIVVVIAGNAFMKDVLDFMTMGTFPNCQNRCLLFCRAGEESPDDTKLANEFSNANFKYKCTTIAYVVAKETKSVQGFYRSFLDDCRCSWETKSIFSILETALKLPLAYESLSLYHREGKLGGDFLRDIFKFIREPKSNLDEVDALPAASEQAAQDKPTDWMRENASIIYPNRRNPKKPRALVIINYDRGDSLYSALQVDRSRVMRMLKNLGYIVTDVQTRSNDALKRRIELFSEDTEHGDSCILVVLSQTQQQLSSSTVMNLYKSLAIGEKLEAKPRLFILHEWDVTTLQTDSVTDGFSSNTYEIIEDAVDGLQAYFRKHDSTIKVHPHSGMVFGRSQSSQKCSSSILLILCEVSESEENFANTQMPEELPEKFSVVRVCRNRCGVIEFLDSLLESPRKNISLNGSFVQLVIFENCRDPGRWPKSELAFFPDMIVAHSTSPDESSYRMTDRGSRFIQCLCTVLDLFADKCDIASMVPIVNYVVQNATFNLGISQLPW